MKQEMKEEIKLNKWNLVLFIVSILLVILSGYFFFQSNGENTLYKTILYADSQFSEVSLIDQQAENYYSEASLAYEKKEYILSESNCRLARGYYSQASQGYKEIKSGLEKSNIDDELITIYSKSLGILSEIQLNMYETCEHFESASRYYETYYNTNVPYNDPSYDMGTNEINAMNEKIKLHDENVRRYNDLLSDYKIELESRLR